MELLNVIESHAFRLWLAQATVLFFMVAGVALLAIGAGLIINSAGALRFFGGMNRSVSVRRATRQLEIPRDTRQAVQRYRHWLAAIFVVGGAFAVFGLVTRFDARAVIFVFDLDTLRPVVANALADGIRWVLVVGNLVGVVVGVMLAFFPEALVALEARGSHWYSERRLTKGGEKSNLGLDAWVAAHPRPAGWTIVLAGLGLLGAFGLMLPAVW